MPDERCDELREPLAELALGIASGEQRARVIEHAGGCAGCQRLLSELSLIGDELLRLAPEHEPPRGFEVRVLERLGRPARRRRPSVRGWRSPALAAVVAAAVAGAAAVATVLRATEDERRLGGQLQAVLSRADGKYLAVTELRDEAGREAGLVFHYGGDPSWIFVTLERPLPAGRYAATLVTRAGRTRALGTFELAGGALSFGAATRVDLLKVTRMRVRAERGGPVYTARFQ